MRRADGGAAQQNPNPTPKPYPKPSPNPTPTLTLTLTQVELLSSLLPADGRAPAARPALLSHATLLREPYADSGARAGEGNLSVEQAATSGTYCVLCVTYYLLLATYYLELTTYCLLLTTSST